MDNKRKIVQQVTKFIQGGDQSNLNMLNDALHDKFSNVQNGFFGKKGIYIIDKDNYLSLISDKTFGGIPRSMDIISVDIANDISMVKVNLKSKNLHFESFISLVKIENDEWKVIGNFPHVKQC